MKTKFKIAGICSILIICSYIFTADIDKTKNDMFSLNVEALTNDESGSDLWFSNLRSVRCPITRVNAIGGFYFNNILIPIGGTYTTYGSKMRCEREITTNNCHLSQETSCRE